MTGRNNVFAGLAIERNGELRDDPDFVASHRADARGRFLLLDDDPSGRRALAQGDALRWLGMDEYRALAGELEPSYLGDDGAGPLFSLCADTPLARSIGARLRGEFIDLRSAGIRLHPSQAGLFAYARALAHWQARTRFCATCGAPLELTAFGHRANCTNPDCALEHFPRVDPAMIVIVGWRDRCLLGRQASWAENRYSTLAGFVEPGESVEDAVRREVYEEAGVRVGACSYHSSQPWPFPASLMLGFSAEAEDPTIRIGAELSDARWFSADELVDSVTHGRIILPPPVSVSHELIAHWLRETARVELAELVAPKSW